MGCCKGGAAIERGCMNKKGKAAVIFAILVAVAGVFLVGWTFGRQRLMVEAIRTGHAHHVITDEYGHTNFQWLEKGDR